jgi:hypothetical protein
MKFKMNVFIFFVVALNLSSCELVVRWLMPWLVTMEVRGAIHSYDILFML